MLTANKLEKIIELENNLRAEYLENWNSGVLIRSLRGTRQPTPWTTAF